MPLILISVCIAVAALLIAIWIKRTRDRRELELHSITADELHTLLAANREVLLFDVRLIPRDKDAVVYCTCPSDKTSRLVLHRAQAMKLSRVKFLKGGLAAWKAKGYPVERYEKTFHLDTRT